MTRNPDPRERKRSHPITRATVFVAVLLSSIVAMPAFAKAPTETPALAAHPPGAVISSANHHATDAGLEILAKGGNAFDAAVAVSAALSVVEPVSSGIGGGGFFLLRDARTGKDAFVDARETAPASARPALYLDAAGNLDRDKAENGPLSAGIPGLPAGLVHIAGKYGKLPLSVSLAPAIRLAREGFELYPRMVESYAERREVMERFAGTRKVYLANGHLPAVGDVLRQPELARTLELLAAHGNDGFYRGEIAAAMLADVKKYGGDWTAADLASYVAKEREPLRIRYRDWDIVTAPPPSSGGVVLAEILQVLEGWDLAKLDEAHRAHVIVEAMRRAYRDRGLYLGDPDFVQMPLARLTSDDYAAGLRASILPDKATPSAMLPSDKAPLDGDNTTHFSIIDREGNLVAATQTVNLAYGSGLVVDGGGFLLNDEMDDFALKPATPNAYGVIGYDANLVAPGHRMLSSMSPSFMIGRDKIAVLGAKGGSRIITMTLLGMLGIEQGMDPAQIAAMPRFHHQYLPDVISAEPGALSPSAISALEAMGHVVKVSDAPWTFYLQAADWDRRSNTLRGGADPRNPPGSARVVPRVSPRGGQCRTRTGDGHGEVKLWSIDGNTQRLDGGAMFGNVPRPMWEQWISPDEGNRIPLACRALLADGVAGKRVLFETGIGAFFEPKLRQRFGVVEDRHVLLDSLKAAGYSHEDIDVVVLSHLHFDHAGGLLSMWREGESPSLLFPNATYLVSAACWERACDPHPRDRASFIAELPALLKASGRLEIVDGEFSQALGHAVRFHFSEGHTPGLMLAEIVGDHGKGGVVFCADLIPGRPWVHLPVTMGYDRYPEMLIDEKREFLGDMLERGVRLFFTHDTGCALAEVRRDEKGRYSTTNEQAALVASAL